ncbi:DNA adenine methylase [Roseospira goensis]|uniref:DNA adenine methylase n=1 Tax=Roseospira goensis TaxID=391922 RepID=A0A7W6S3U0_9PROT|nr:DNA adenine methylase [Roseospira goensis]MBB4287845.1 DNA adenine methylase [Roseospira goensis]
MESTPETRTCAPIRPVAPWIGGKRNLARRLVQLIETVPHTLYAEPFVGMAGVFLRRTRIPKAEVINDASGDVATFFRILQRHYPQFMDTLRFQITSRRDFDRLCRVDPATLTDLERAARFLVLQRLAFAGKVVGRTFGVHMAGPARFNLNTLGPQLADLHERLAGVVIENLDFGAFLRRYDRPTTLFYCDPPYVGVEDYYGKGLFTAEDHRRLAAILLALKGSWILSINDHPLIRDLYAGCRIDDAPVRYTAARDAPAKAVTELIIRPPDPL